MTEAEGGHRPQQPDLDPRDADRAAAYAARWASIRRTVETAHADQREQEYLEHVFGLNPADRA